MVFQGKINFIQNKTDVEPFNLFSEEEVLEARSLNRLNLAYKEPGIHKLSEMLMVKRYSTAVNFV